MALEVKGLGLCEPVRRAGGSSAWCGLLTLAQGYPGEAGVQLPDCQEVEPWCEPRKPRCLCVCSLLVMMVTLPSTFQTH